MLAYAVIGTSWITDSFIEGASLAGGMTLRAVYSRDREKGRAFGAKYGVETVYTSLEALGADPAVDAVYIASPNAFHYRQAKALLQAGKHIICEKPATVYPWQLEELTALAEEKGLIFMEAIMLLHQPHFQIIKDALLRLGKITAAHFDFSQRSSKYDAYRAGSLPNIFNPRMATGSFMDLGVYCVYPMAALFGEPLEIKASASFMESGADGTMAALCRYPDKLVTVTASKLCQDRAGSQILGDEGTLIIGSISKGTEIRFVGRDGKEEILFGDCPKAELMGNEAADFCRFVSGEGLEDYRRMTRTALLVSRIMEKTRAEAGIAFPEETAGEKEGEKE